MAKANPDTVILKGMPIIKEGTANAALSPGHYVAHVPSGSIGKNLVAGEAGVRNVAIENDLAGKGINDAYAANDRVLYASFAPGDEAYVRVAASAPAIRLGDDLAVTGSGTIAKLTGSQAVVARALESVDNSSNSASEVFIRVEIA